MCGLRKNRLYTKTGEPYCRICSRAIWDKKDLDALEERTHTTCAEDRREKARRKEALTPYFKTEDEEKVYTKKQAENWSFLNMAW